MTELEARLARLNPEQRTAVETTENTVVLAGPGSGKTDTTTLKIARLLQHDVQAPRGVAVITYSNDAVRELTSRLRGIGIRPDRRLFVGTVHGFCLNRVLHPYSTLAEDPALASPSVRSPKAQRATLQHALDAAGANENPQYFEGTLTKIRRSLAWDEPLDPYDERHVEAARIYEASLADAGEVDFEAMTLKALNLIETIPTVAELIVARYPWIAVDEYQDLGGPLHRIVLALQRAGSKIFAVGDPDQCIYGFSGADPSLLEDLANDPNFTAIPLRFNYRSGSRLITAAAASLSTPRNYEADPDRSDEGEIYFDRIEGGLEAQAKWVVHGLVPQLIDDGVEAHEIAVLYKGRGPQLDALVHETATAVPAFVLERDTRFPSTPYTRWLQRCATKALDGPDADPMTQLMAPYRQLMARAGVHDDELAARCRLLDALNGAQPDTPLHEWIRSTSEVLGLAGLLAADSTLVEDEDALNQLCREPDEETALATFAQSVQIRDCVAITTLHGSKGRQFDVVVLPGLQASLFPMARWTRGEYRSEPGRLAEDRRLFYVGLTRARHQVHLVYSPSFTNRFGYVVEGRSSFVDEVEVRLREAR